MDDLGPDTWQTLRNLLRRSMRTDEERVKFVNNREVSITKTPFGWMANYLGFNRMMITTSIEDCTWSSIVDVIMNQYEDAELEFKQRSIHLRGNSGEPWYLQP